jgi:malonate-semialdehyde dehydrogenase (acetylating)/methylmalonate-semialdehyde dehydrogenase
MSLTRTTLPRGPLFGGWKDSLFDGKRHHGSEGVSFYTRAKIVTSRWPEVQQSSDSGLHVPTAT